MYIYIQTYIYTNIHIHVAVHTGERKFEENQFPEGLEMAERWRTGPPHYEKHACVAIKTVKGAHMSIGLERNNS